MSGFKLDKAYVLSYWITLISYILCFVVIALTMGYDYNSSFENVWIRRVGLVVFLFGWWLWYKGRKTLGHESVDIDPLTTCARFILSPGKKRERHAPEKLITTGIYKITKHPQYWGTVVFYIGFSIALASIPALVFSLAVVLPLHIWRAIVEEKMNTRIFGEEYTSYNTAHKF